MSTRSLLLEMAKLVKNDLDSLLSQCTDSEKHENGTYAKWSVKDMLAHVGYWSKRFLGRVEIGLGLLEGTDPGQVSDFEKANAAIFEDNKDRSFEEILGDYQNTCNKWIKLLEEISDENLNSIGKVIPNANRSLSFQIVGTTGWHPEWHFAQYLVEHNNPQKADELQEKLYSHIRELWHGFAEYNLACYYANFRHSGEKAVSLLAEAFKLRPELREEAPKDSDLDSLHDDPAFQALLK